MHLKIYLDNNASTLLDPRVRDYIISLLNSLEGNPSSTHSYGQKVRAAIAQARNAIATYLKVRSNELIFTSGGSESANMIIKGILHQGNKGHLITSTVEHSCVYNSARWLETNGFQVTFLNPGLYGAVSTQAVIDAIRPETKLIALLYVNNETGVKTDINEIAKVALTSGIPFFVDAVSLLGKELFTIPNGVSAMSFSGHKLHAPQGIGLTFVRSGLKLNPLITGGEQEFGKRAGTENVLGILGLAKAVELLETELPQASEKMQMLRDKFERKVMEALPKVTINGTGPRTVNVSNLAFAGVDGEAMLMALDAAGVAASHGSACASGSLEPSRVLLEMGLPLELVRGSIRFSLSRFTTDDEIDRAADIVVNIAKRLNIP